MRSLRHYVENHGITVEVLSGPDWATDEEGWEHYKYEVKLINPRLGTEMVVPWMTGVAITEGPDERPEVVIDSLVCDGWGYQNVDGFEDWADEYGYDADSRKAEKVYQAVGKIAQDFITFIGGRDELEKLALRYERM